MNPADWLLTAVERGNPATVLDRRRRGGAAWSDGNRAVPLVHGATYFAALAAAVADLRAGDLLLFTDWRGDPDERLTDAPGSTVGEVLAAAAARGVDVRGLVWRSHWDRLAFSAAENRHLGEQIEAAGGQCLLDMRVRTGGSHHQKFVVLRHRGRPERDVAFVGGIDLCHSRRDDARHGGDPQRQPMAAAYGATPPWHDAMVALHGPVVADVETVFRERWDDPQPLTRSPLRRWADRRRGDAATGRPLPPAWPDPPAAGPHRVQLLRTYPRRAGGYPFAPQGERSVARGYAKALRRARRLVYLEDQYLWSGAVVASFAAALRAQPQLQLLAVLPPAPDQDGRWSLPPNLLGRRQALQVLCGAAPGRVHVFGVENPAGTPVYVHAKVCVIDDTWASIGSDNVNRRSWTHDSELSAVVLDPTVDTRVPVDPAGLGDGARRYARDLRLALLREHLDRCDPDSAYPDGAHPDTDPDRASATADAGLLDPAEAVATVAASAAALDAWVAAGRVGPRPPGRLRPLATPDLRWRTRVWATPLYRAVYDPDGRPGGLRRGDRF